MKPFSLMNVDPRIRTLALNTEKTVLARWVVDCAERVLPLFEAKNPRDKRPRAALDTLEAWIKTGKFHMSVIRKASLDAHEAARDVGEDSPARSAARACAQAVATAHIHTHSISAAMYALQAISRNTELEDVEAALTKESEWQYKHLLKLSGQK